MAPVYATPSDLTAWTGAVAPVNAIQLLRSASILVRDATSGAYYTADINGLPTDGPTLEAFRDATTAQASFWTASNIDPNAAGFATAGVLKTKRLGTASLDYDTNAQGSVTAFNARRAAATELCTEALRILAQASINLTGPWITG